MKLKLVASAALLAMLSLPAQAGQDMKDAKDLMITPTLRSDEGTYMAVYGGVNWSTNFGDKRTVVSFGGSNTNITPDNVNSGPGAVGGIKGGYNFEPYEINESLSLQPAVEGEALYIGDRSSAHLNGGTDDLTLSYNSAAFFANGIVRFIISGTRITPYLGLGIGGEYITNQGDDCTGGQKITGLHASDIDFAFQGLMGCDFGITPHWSIFTEYKFIDAIDSRFEYLNFGSSGANVFFKPDQFAQQIGTIGLKYNF